MEATAHPEAKRLRAYLLGQLAAPQVREIEVHLANCRTCRSAAEGMDGASDSFFDCLRQTASEPPHDPALESLLARARNLGETVVSMAATAPPKKVAGHEVVYELARGGLGVVYLAYHPVLKANHVIKRPLTRDDLDRAQLLARFQREVEAVGNLKHDHIIHAYDAGTDDDGPYLVMEYVDGEPLSRVLSRQRHLPVAQACELIRQAALGLQAAHERGLVHRDIKPSNLMLARAHSGARVVIIDWGLVKWTTEAAARGPQPTEPLTAAGSGMGTPDFMAPEQFRDARSVDIRADIYSLGATLYCLLVGRPPFHDRQDPDKFFGHQREAFPPLQRLRGDVPAELEAVLNQMVHKDPQRRYAAPKRLVEALQPFCQGAGSTLVNLLQPTPTTEAVPAIETEDQLKAPTAAARRSASGRAPAPPTLPPTATFEPAHSPALPASLMPSVPFWHKRWIALGVGAAVVALAGLLIYVFAIRPGSTKKGGGVLEAINRGN